MDDAGETYVAPSFTFEDGSVLPDVHVRYKTFGTLNADKSNSVVVCHALTGNASVDIWWTGMVGEGCATLTPTPTCAAIAHKHTHEHRRTSWVAYRH